MVFELKLYPDGRTPSAMSFKLSEETKKQRKEKSTSPNLRENEKKKDNIFLTFRSGDLNPRFSVIFPPMTFM